MFFPPALPLIRQLAERRNVASSKKEQVDYSKISGSGKARLKQKKKGLPGVAGKPLLDLVQTHLEVLGIKGLAPPSTPSKAHVLEHPDYPGVL
jgi:hypothetical protein